jgi:Flp pilus assembly protein CpaB
MRRGRVFILLALLLLVGAAGIFVVLSGGLGGGPAAEPTPVPTPIGEAEIVIAAQHIARGSLIPAEAVIVSPYPADYKVETMLDDPGQVIGRRARMDIGRGVPITENMITEDPGDLLSVGSDASFAIPPGFTAISIPMDRFSGVAFAMRAGDQVDVLVSMLVIDLDPDFQSETPNRGVFLFNSDGDLLTSFSCLSISVEEGEFICEQTEATNMVGKIEFDESSGEDFFVVPSGPGRPRLVTQRLISNATVLGVGNFPLLAEEEEPVVVQPEPEEGVGAPAAQQPAAPVEAPAVEPPDIITLIVEPEDALALNWALGAGVDLTLTLRSPNDPTAEFETDSVTLQVLVDNYNIAVPSKLPYGLEPLLQAPPLDFPPSFEPEEPSEG